MKSEKNDKNDKVIKQIILIFIGVALIGLGIAINILNKWGSDSVSVFAQSISIKLAGLGSNFFSVGHVLILINLIIFIVLTTKYKLKYFNIGTFAGMFCVGFFADIWIKLLSNVINSDGNIVLKIFFSILGVVILSIGIGLYISGNMGAAPVDLISVIISEKFRLDYAKVRMCSDGSFLILGWLLGGTVGITTLLCILMVGPISGLIIKYINKNVLTIK